MEAEMKEISAQFHAGHKKTDIVKLQNVSLSTVKQVANRLKNIVSFKGRPRSGRPQLIQRKNVQKAFLKDTTLKMTEFAKGKKISVTTVLWAIKSEGGKSLKHRITPLLTTAMVHKRHEWYTRLLNDKKVMANGSSFFSDEKTFTTDPVINKQNDRFVSFSQGISDVRFL